MIPKEIKYNLHYDDVREDFTKPLVSEVHRIREN